MGVWAELAKRCCGDTDWKINMDGHRNTIFVFLEYRAHRSSNDKQIDYSRLCTITIESAIISIRFTFTPSDRAVYYHSRWSQTSSLAEFSLADPKCFVKTADACMKWIVDCANKISADLTEEIRLAEARRQTFTAIEAGIMANNSDCLSDQSQVSEHLS